MQGKSRLVSNEIHIFNKSCLSSVGIFVLRVIISDRYTYSQIIICLSNLLTVGVHDECYARIHSHSPN
jgi:hypothetical protein